LSKLFQCFISRVTTSEIVSKLFRRHWTCWKIFISCNKPLKIFWSNFRHIYFSWDHDEGWNDFISHVTTAQALSLLLLVFTP